jgi:hypothetical protein
VNSSARTGDVLVQRGLAAFEQSDELLSVLVARARHLGVAMQRLLDRGEVGQAELGLDHFDVRDRVDLAGHVDHVLVVEAAHHVHGGVGFADVRQELVAQALAGAGAGHQAGNVDELDDGGHHALGIDDRAQLGEPRIGHFHHAHVGLDGAERIVFRCDAGLGQRIEKGGFTDVGQADDAALQTHGRSSWVTRDFRRPWFHARPTGLRPLLRSSRSQG